MGKEIERIVNAERVEDLIAVFGSFDENIKRIEEALEVHVINRGTDLRVSGDEEAVDKAVRTLEGLLTLASRGETIDEQRVRYLITLVSEGNDDQAGNNVDCGLMGFEQTAHSTGQSAHCHKHGGKAQNKAESATERFPGSAFSTTGKVRNVDGQHG